VSIVNCDRGALRAWRDGWRRVLSAPAVLAGALAVSLLAVAPLALALRGEIETHLGSSVLAEQAAAGASWDWWQGFASRATGIGRTLTPSIIGFAATLDNVGGLLDGRRQIAPVAAAIAAYLLAWLFFTGGIVDRYARDEAEGAGAFFAAAGAFIGRLLRLALLAALAYGFLFACVHEQLFGVWYVNATRDLAVERTAFFWRAGFYCVFGALLLAVNVLFDYGKVRLIVEDRTSVVGALAAALRFISRHPRRVGGLYALNAAVLVMVLGAWAIVAPGAGRAGLSAWLGFLATQVYMLARLTLKLQFVASETALWDQGVRPRRARRMPKA
jgi:hypothetical protein